MKRIKCKVCEKKNSKKIKVCPQCGEILDKDFCRLIDETIYGDCKNIDKVSEMKMEIGRQIKYGEVYRHTFAGLFRKEKYEKDSEDCFVND